MVREREKEYEKEDRNEIKGKRTGLEARTWVINRLVFHSTSLSYIFIIVT